MREPGHRGYVVVWVILLVALIALWLLLPLPKNRHSATPSHVGEWGSREQIHHTKEEEENYLTHLFHEMEKSTKRGLPSLRG